MSIDWTLVAQIVVPISTLLLGIVLNRVMERRPKLISYWGEVSAFTLDVGEEKKQVNTHSIVVRNAGARPASDVRISHWVLPDIYTINPPVKHSIDDINDGGRDILIPSLVPGEQITVSYLYYPPLVWDQIHRGIRHKEGFATQTQVLPKPARPLYVIAFAYALMFVGLIAVVYMAIGVLL